MKYIYIDVCALSRPFDDQSFLRIRLETEALNLILSNTNHVAFAEYANAQFITCDDMLIKKCLSHRIAVWCGNPVSFCEKEGLK